MSRRLRSAVRAAWLFALALPATALAQPAPQAPPSDHPIFGEGRRTMTAVRLADGDQIELDGRLDEAVWQRAVPATDFIMQDPILGGTPTERTEVRIVFDRDNLYMGVTAHDSEPDRLLGNTMRRDETLDSDDRFMWTRGPVLEVVRSGRLDQLHRDAGAVPSPWIVIDPARCPKRRALSVSKATSFATGRPCLVTTISSRVWPTRSMSFGHEFLKVEAGTPFGPPSLSRTASSRASTARSATTA